jgi:hypothetical protein
LPAEQYLPGPNDRPTACVPLLIDDQKPAICSSPNRISLFINNRNCVPAQLHIHINRRTSRPDYSIRLTFVDSNIVDFEFCRELRL